MRDKLPHARSHQLLGRRKKRPMLHPVRQRLHQLPRSPLHQTLSGGLQKLSCACSPSTCSTCVKNVSTFFLFLPKSNTCGKRTVMHLLSASITPPGRILTLTSSPYVQPLNGSEARNSLADR